MDKTTLIAIKTIAIVFIIWLGWTVVPWLSLGWSVPLGLTMALTSGLAEGPACLAYRASPVIILCGILNPVQALLAGLIIGPAVVAAVCSLTSAK